MVQKIANFGKITLQILSCKKLAGWKLGGWVDGWMDGWESRFKDCLQQSKIEKKENSQKCTTLGCTKGFLTLKKFGLSFVMVGTGHTM